MIHLPKIGIVLLLLMSPLFFDAQEESYQYRRSIQGVSETWHVIEIPTELYGKTNNELSDLRIFSLPSGAENRTAPYLLNTLSDQILSETVSFQLLNTVHNENGYYYTFEIPSQEKINEINLEFAPSNFDWNIKLEGSQNLSEWYTILDPYRIVSITNSYTQYQFTTLKFPHSQYQYYRLEIPSKSDPAFLKAEISNTVIEKGKYHHYTPSKIEVQKEPNSNNTEIEVSFSKPIRLSRLKVEVENTFDYYIPIEIKYAKDSSLIEGQWIYKFSSLYSGTLNSLETNEFNMTPTTLQKVVIAIVNGDNEVLNIRDIKAQGNKDELRVRFTNPKEDYYLYYGNPNATFPSYDIEKFEENIPTELSALQLGKEEIISSPKEKEKPLFMNKKWLWLILIFGVGLIAYFMIKMVPTMRHNS